MNFNKIMPVGPFLLLSWRKEKKELSVVQVRSGSNTPMVNMSFLLLVLHYE